MKKEQFEQHRKNFLKVRDILKAKKNYFALNCAYRKPFKWYGLYSINEAVSFLIQEAETC